MSKFFRITSEGLEQFCPNQTLTYGSPDKHGAAPLLCAGITTYSPLRHWGVGKGKKVGIVGLGGLGHVGVKFADVEVIPIQKVNDAYERIIKSDVKDRFSIDMASLKLE